MNRKLLDKFNKVEKLHWWWEGRRRLIKTLIRPISPKRILDIGCGTGETIAFLQREYSKAKVFGVDSSDKAVRYSRSRKLRNISKADANKLPFKNNYFDVVLFLDVLEHIKDDLKAVREAKRVLKNNGIIIVTSPALSFIWSKHDVNQGHFRRYSKETICELASDADLKIKFVSYFNFFLSPPIILLRMLSNIGPLKFLANYDRGINYDIAFNNLVNTILKKIFLSEASLLEHIRFPFGISISAVLVK